MKKVLIIFDGVNFSKGAFEFARRMNLQERILLTAVFLPQVEFSNLWSYTSAMNGPMLIPLIEEDEAEQIQDNIAHLEHKCRSNNIEYRLHKDYFDFGLFEIKRESRFADLLLIGSQSFYERMGADEPNENLKDVLHDAQCPVVLVPEKFEFPGSNILAYDGSDSSLFAIKQFAYIFPALCRNKTILVHAGKKDEVLPESEYIKELAARHFPELSIYNFPADPKKYFATWISEQKGAILVSGSFGRSAVSMLFKRSFVTDVIAEHQLPLFIAHR